MQAASDATYQPSASMSEPTEDASKDGTSRGGRASVALTHVSRSRTTSPLSPAPVVPQDDGRRSGAYADARAGVNLVGLPRVHEQ